MTNAFAVDYHWREGSMPPPHHYAYDVALSDTGAAEIRFRPDYPGEHTPEWTAGFTVPAPAIEALQRLIRDEGVLDAEWREHDSPPVGGEYRWMVVRAGDVAVDVPPFPTEPGGLAAIYAMIEALVPDPIWRDLRARRARYVAENE